MITEEEKEQHLRDLQETFKLDRRTAEKLVEAHDTYLSILMDLPNPKTSLILSITSSIALAAATDTDPYDYMVLVHEILMQLSESFDGVGGNPVGDA